MIIYKVTLKFRASAASINIYYLVLTTQTNYGNSCHSRDENDNSLNLSSNHFNHIYSLIRITSHS